MLYIPIILLVIVLVVWYKQYEKAFYNKPDTYPNATKLNGKPVFVAFGDSLTQGNMSANWVAKLANARPNLQVFNAGMNADLTYTLLNRIDDLLACQPQYISLWVGCNDVNATMAPARMQRYYALGKITQDADHEGFVKNYRELIEVLIANTTAKIAIVSIAPITEDWQHPANQKGDIYNETVKQLAAEYNLDYIPFRETLRNNMPQSNGQLSDYELGFPVIRRSCLKHYFLGKSWNEIATERKCMYLTDNIHLNDTAADIVLQQMLSFLDKNR
jgi:lysophospholipase L1-like esterase